MNRKTVFCVVVIGLVSLMLNLGCAQTREDAAISMAKEIALKVVDKARLDQTTLSASGQIVNPEYEFIGWGATGVIVGGKVRAVGIDVKAAAHGSGLGEGTHDQDLREKLYQISERKNIGAEERKRLIAEAVADFINRTTIEDKTPEKLDIQLPATTPAGETVVK